MIIYLADREIGIQWEDRGIIYTIDRDGEKGERFTPPWGSERIDSSDMYSSDWVWY